jgi:hypothetical protein
MVTNEKFRVINTLAGRVVATVYASGNFVTHHLNFLTAQMRGVPINTFIHDVPIDFDARMKGGEVYLVSQHPVLITVFRSFQPTTTVFEYIVLTAKMMGNKLEVVHFAGSFKVKPHL